MKRLSRINFEPTEEIIDKLLYCLNIKNLEDYHCFTKYDMYENNSVEKILDLLPEISIYYFSSELKQIFDNLNIHTPITIANHFLIRIGYMIERRPIMEKRKKKILYRLIKKNNFSKKIIFQKNNFQNLNFKKNIFYVDFN